MAQLIITVNDALVPRIRAALKSAWELDSLPTTAQIEAYLKQHIRNIVIEQEARAELRIEQARIADAKQKEQW